MKTIDFLPEIYRQREALRRARLWWGIVVVIFSAAIGASVMAQAWMRHGLQQQLDALAPEYAAAQSQVQELSALQAQIVRASHEASLYTFLENPWPRTQLLAVVVRPLPNSIRLTKISLIDEELARNATQAGPRNTKAEEEAAAKATHPEKDLAKLQDELDRRQTTIEIDGHTTDVPRLHEYVGDVSRSPLVASATIKSLEAGAANQQGRTRFTLRMTVRPGYCQRGGDIAGSEPAALPAQRRLAGGGGG
jgi:Tfp pilus assembly protein PilN